MTSPNESYTETTTAGRYATRPVDWQTRITLITAQGGERDGGPLSFDWDTNQRGVTEDAMTETLTRMGYTPWFVLRGIAVYTGGDAPQTHPFCASLAIGGSIRVLAFETLSALSACVATWVPILDAVEDTYSGA